VKPNTIVAVSGANGTGKTTLARLLAGVLEPGRGQILVDGLDLQQASLSWWRSQIAYLPQEPTLLNATIRENLLVVNPQADETRVGLAIQAAGLGRYLDESPDGLDAKVTNNGLNLSLGIRRRIALARALLSECKLAVFDEPTDGLDREGIACVYAVINDLAKRGCTIIVISHDPKIVKGAHVVVDLGIKPAPRVTERPRFVERAEDDEKEVS
jgi:ATP-binding cassette subfamily C protein LapB